MATTIQQFDHDDEMIKTGEQKEIENMIISHQIDASASCGVNWHQIIEDLTVIMRRIEYSASADDPQPVKTASDGVCSTAGMTPPIFMKRKRGVPW